MTFAELETLWTANGGDPFHAYVAAEIALAESSGCPYALAAPIDIRPVKSCIWRQTSGEFSVGLWQINTYAHPQYNRRALFGADANAKAAIAVSNNGTNFTPWTTYTSGAYLRVRTGQLPLAPPSEPQPHVTKAWAQLAHNLSVTMPTQLRRAALIQRRFLR